MIDILTIRENSEMVLERLSRRNLPHAKDVISKILILDVEKRKILTALEEGRAEMNLISKSVGQLIASGKKEEAEIAKTRTGEIKEQIRLNEEKLAQTDADLIENLLILPNMPHPSVPFGKTPEDNVTVFRNEISDTFPDWMLPHWELTKAHNLIDFDLGAKIAGAGFPVYIGKGAKLQRALIAYFLEAAEQAGYIEIMPPLLVNADSGYGTGQLPDKEGQMYYVELDDLYLIPTAEVPITNLYRDVIVKEQDLPIKNCGYTPCFRREAGSYGKDVRGLNRLHQFDKVEIVQIASPENSYDLLEIMVEHVKSLLNALELPYRTLLLCGGDMGFASAKTFDMEVFSGGQKKWLEVSSISNFESFQANRMKLRIKDATDKKTRLAHTLNGSALALPRIMASLIENHQQADGSIRIPAVLHKFTGFEKIG